MYRSLVLELLRIRGGIGAGRGKRMLPEKELHFGGPRLGVCDMLGPIQEPKWKSWMIPPDVAGERKLCLLPKSNAT